MIRSLRRATTLFAVSMFATAAASAQERHSTNNKFDALIARHAAANNVPEALVRRIIHRESRGNARAVSKGNYGLMQIRLGTARALGYRGTAAGLLDADTNMTYAVKYLAGAYRVAGGNPDRAVHYYASGYYFAAKRKGLLDQRARKPVGAYASASASESARPLTTPKALRERIKTARENGDSVTTSSDMYTGKLDYF